VFRREKKRDLRVAKNKEKKRKRKRRVMEGGTVKKVRKKEKN